MRPFSLLVMLAVFGGCEPLFGIPPDSMDAPPASNIEEPAPPGDGGGETQSPWDLPDPLPSAPAVVDWDGDGAPAPMDCDDREPLRAPSLPELCDGWDNDCDDAIDEGFDQDEDGLTTCQGDCDDGDAAIPIPAGTPDLCDGIDANCGGIGSETDEDEDGWLVCEGDCDDANADVHPGLVDDVCDGVDWDCGNSFWETDPDEDGFLQCADDCDENNPNVYPGAEEVCDGQDNDCNGEVDELEDADGDGVSVCGDCDDTDPTVYPGANEICDGKENNCSGWGADVDIDGDGYGPCDGDCLELMWSSSEINPGATETCDGVDEDCDGDVDEDFDADGDGLTVCGADGIAQTADDDCSDTNPSVPGPEVCNGFDEDCDGIADEDFDADGDGLSSCGPDGLVGTIDDDCDDFDPTRRPGLLDLPGDGIDSDCDGVDTPPGAPVPAPTGTELRDWMLDRIELARTGPTPSPSATCPAMLTTVAPALAGASLSGSMGGSLSGIWRSCSGSQIGGGLVGSLSHSSTSGDLWGCNGSSSSGSGGWSAVPVLMDGGLTWSGTGWSFSTSGYGYMGSCGCSNSWSSSSTDAGGDFVVRRDPGAPPLMGLPEGWSTINWARDRSSGYHGWYDPGCVGPTTETFDIDVQARLDSSPWTVLGTADWEYTASDGWSPATGCQDEPTSGAFTATADGLTVQLVFDTVCDGCFQWYIDGVSQGPYCTTALAL